MPRKLTQEALEVQAVPLMPVQDGRSAPPLQDLHAQVELDADGVPLGAVSVEADGVDPDQAKMPGVRSVTWWCMVPVLARPGVAILAPGSFGTGGSGIAGLPLLGPPSSLSPSID
jgi:hypothetical protein